MSTPEDIISTYTFEEAIEDGNLADFGYISPGVRLVTTPGFMASVNTYQLMHIFLTTVRRIRPDGPNWVVFKPDAEQHLEDEGRTLVTPCKGIKENVYAILEDHGPYQVLTILLASEY